MQQDSGKKAGIGPARPAAGKGAVQDAERGAERRNAHGALKGQAAPAGRGKPRGGTPAAECAAGAEVPGKGAAEAAGCGGDQAAARGSGAEGSLHAGRSRLVFGPLSETVSDIDPARTVIVTEPEVRRLYGGGFPPCPLIEVPRGEAAKSLASLEKLYGAFLEKELDRSSTVLGIGGGTVSDLSGFAASTWMRGIDFGFVPTTLLAMVDASVGGKNGVDFKNYKNLVGTFSEPRFVRFDVSLLDTLSPAEFASGMAEVIKHAVIDSSGYLDFLEAECPDRGTLFGQGGGSPAVRRAKLEELVRRSLVLKASVVEEDEKEAGRRRVLNLGHTIGHAVEEVTGLPHGFAVAAGLASALRLGALLAGFPEADALRVLSLLDGWGLPSTLGAVFSPALRSLSTMGPLSELDGREAIARSLAADKKRIGSSLLFALPHGIGDVRIEALPLDDLREFAKVAE